MRKTFIWVCTILGAGSLLFIAYWIWVFTVFAGLFDRNYSKVDLIDNYKLKTNEINELKNYAQSIIPYGKSVTIEFENDRKLAIFHVSDQNGRSDNWDLIINSKKVDTLMIKLGWKKQTLKTLKEKLDDADCISIQSGKPLKIGYQRSGMGMYFYNLFDEPMTDSMKHEYNDGCVHILYNEKIALEYGGGAIGAQCFENFKRK